MNPDVQYSIVVKTANSTASGIISLVFLKVHGKRGALKPIKLGDKKSLKQKTFFARNSVSEFIAKRQDVGFITSIEVWHNDEGHDWDCEYIDISKGLDSWRFTPKDRIAASRKDGTMNVISLEGVHSVMSNGATPFHNAAKKGDQDELQRMMTKNEYTVDVKDRMGRTAAMYAAQYGQYEALALLIAQKADILYQDDSGKTVLHHACTNNIRQKETIDVILKHAPRTSKMENKYAREDHPNIDYINYKDIFGKNSVHYAATFGFVSIISNMDMMGSIVNSIREKDRTGQCPLHCAAIQGEAEAAKKLINLDAELQSVDSETKTFIHHAAIVGAHEFIKEIMSEFRPNVGLWQRLEQLLSAQDITGRIPALCAAGAHTNALDTVRVLDELGSNMTHEDYDGSNILHHGARRGDDSLLSYLQTKQSINKANDYLFTPLHVAVANNNIVGAKWLLAHKADVFAYTRDKEQAIHLAEKQRNEPMIQMLRNEMNIRNVEAKMIGASMEGKLNDDVNGSSIEDIDEFTTHDADDKYPFFDGNVQEGQSIPQSLLDELEWLRREVKRLRAENESLREKFRKNKKILELLKKRGVNTAELEQLDENALRRMCKDPNCVVM